MGHHLFCVDSEKGAPEAEFNTHDGTIKINCDEIWDTIKNDYYGKSEDALIWALIDRIVHEDYHKAFSEAVDSYSEVFNEQDERIMMCIRDWVEYGIMRSIIQYDWK